MNDHACYYCGPTERALRPYGPGGAMVCHPCITETSERERAAAQAFLALVDAAGAVSGDDTVIIGTEEGPIPGNRDV